MMAELPKWTDDEAMLAWIGPLIPDPPRDYLFVPWHEWHPPFAEPDCEREAIAAARQGNLKMLGHLPQSQLSAEAWQLVAARLRGETKGAKGPPKQSAARRRVNNPVHAAADEVAVIENILRQHFPGQQGNRGRAIDLAAARAGVFRETLADRLAHPGRRI